MKELAFEILNGVLTKKGFRKKGKAWYYSPQKGVEIGISFQSSVMTKAYFLNFGIYFQFGDSKKLPASYTDWHFTGRYAKLIDSTELNDVYISYEVNEEKIREDIEKICLNIDNIILPYLITVSSPDYLVNNFDNNFEKLWLQNITQDQLLTSIQNKFLHND